MRSNVSYLNIYASGIIPSALRCKIKHFCSTHKQIRNYFLLISHFTIKIRANHFKASIRFFDSISEQYVILIVYI